MRFISRNTILILGIILIIFILSIYFFYQPDNLIEYVPENSFLYLHLDLNQARRTGYLGNKWLNDLKTQQVLGSFLENDSRLVLIKNVFKTENIKPIDEVALILFPEETIYEKSKGPLSTMEVKILLKLKRWVNPSLLIKSLKDFHVQKLTNRVWLVSSQPFSSDFQSSDFFLSQNLFKQKDSLFSKVRPLVWASGYVNFGELQEEIKEEKSFAKISFYSVLGSENLFFSIDLPSQDYEESLFSFNNFILDNNSEQGFIFVLPQINSTDFLLQKIKQALAVQNPIKKQVTLPDQTRFTELVVDLNKFNFKTKEFNQTLAYYWPMDFFENQEQTGLIVWQDKGQNFISNKISLFKEAINDSNKFFSGFQIQEIEKGIFFQSKKLPFKDLLIIQKEQEIKGRLTLSP